MPQLILPEYVLDDLSRFISRYNSNSLPHPLLIAQAFLLMFPDHGNKYDLPIITTAVEHVICPSQKAKSASICQDVL